MADDRNNMGVGDAVAADDRQDPGDAGSSINEDVVGRSDEDFDEVDDDEMEDDLEDEDDEIEER